MVIPAAATNDFLRKSRRLFIFSVIWYDLIESGFELIKLRQRKGSPYKMRGNKWGNAVRHSYVFYHKLQLRNRYQSLEGAEIKNFRRKMNIFGFRTAEANN